MSVSELGDTIAMDVVALQDGATGSNEEANPMDCCLAEASGDDAATNDLAALGGVAMGSTAAQRKRSQT